MAHFGWCLVHPGRKIACCQSMISEKANFMDVIKLSIIEHTWNYDGYRVAGV